MLQMILVLAALCSLAPLARSSEGHAAFLAAPPPPVVTATSSQYFERTFNRLVGALLPEPAPVVPVFPAPPVIQTHPVLPAQAPVAPVHPVFQAQTPQVFFQPAPKPVSPTPSNVEQPAIQNQGQPDPNVAIAIATAHAAAPVATILLPPYPFGFPPTGFIPEPPINVPDEPKESTTQPATTLSPENREPEQTTPQPSASNSDNSFAQTLPNQNVNSNYGPPPDLPRPLQPFPLQPDQQVRPQKLRTTVEIVPVPLTYIAPPPLTHAQLYNHHHHHQHHHPHHHVKYYIHAVPAPVRAKLIIRPVPAPVKLRVKLVKPVTLKKYRVPISWERSDTVIGNDILSDMQIAKDELLKDREPTTEGPISSPNTKPPRL